MSAPPFLYAVAIIFNENNLIKELKTHGNSIHCCCGNRGNHRDWHPDYNLLHQGNSY